MKTQQSHKANWWLPGLLVALMVGLLVEVHRLVPSSGWRIALEIAILLFSYGLMEIWLRRNSFALIQDEVDHSYTNVIIVEALPVSALPALASVYDKVERSTLVSQPNDTDYRGTAPTQEAIAVGS